jgi:hypothetical protein
MMRPEHFAYFKDLFEGRAAVSWRAWFKQHDAQLAQDLPRADYLRLKFHMLDEAEKLLRQAGIEFTVSPLAKREKYYSLLHASVLDERGRPKESFRRKAYNGAVGQFLDGEPAKAKETLTAFLRKLNRRPMEKRIEELEEMCFDGEMNFEYGDRELGRMMLELVAALEFGDDLLDPAIFRAREVLGQGGC